MSGDPRPPAELTPESVAIVKAVADQEHGGDIPVAFTDGRKGFARIAGRAYEREQRERREMLDRWETEYGIKGEATLG